MGNFHKGRLVKLFIILQEKWRSRLEKDMGDMSTSTEFISVESVVLYFKLLLKGVNQI